MDCTDGMESKKPKVGDISLCLKCMEISLFSKGFILRVPEAAKLIEIQRSIAWPKIERARAKWRQLKIKEQISAAGR